jgi:hypothetical protein
MAICNMDATFTDTRKVVFGLTSPSSISLLSGKNYYAPYDRPYQPPAPPYLPPPQTSVGGRRTYTPRSVPHTYAALNRTDLATYLEVDATWASNGLSSQKKDIPTRHHHIIERYKIIFASVTAQALSGARPNSQLPLTARPT